MKFLYREMALRFADELANHDFYKPKKNRRQLREALYQYYMQELSVLTEKYLDTDEGSMSISCVERIYHAKPPARSARYGTSGYHK